MNGAVTAAPIAEVPPIRLLGDIACPWTYLTLAALQRAFGAGFALEWHPFLLNLQDLARQRDRLAAPVAEYAGRMRLGFVPAALAQPVDALLVHGVVLAAAREGRGAAAARALFDARFGGGTALVERRTVRAALAERLAGAEAERWVQAAPGHAGVVERATRAARLAGVSEIPLTVLDNALVIGGLQPPEAYTALAELALIQRAGRA